MKRTILCILIVLMLGVLSTLSIYQYSKLNQPENKVIDVTDSSSLAMVLVDENGRETETESFPSSSEYYLDVVKSYCKNDSLIEWDKNTSKVKIISEKADFCKLYFRKNTSYNLKSHIMATNAIGSTLPDFSVKTTDGEYGLYKAQDDLGISYYFRGDVENNYVKFGTYTTDNIKYTAAGTYFDDLESCQASGAGQALGCSTATFWTKDSSMYWRIVRINGDGSIRLLYAGAKEEGSDTFMLNSFGLANGYNSSCSGDECVGYTYTVDGVRTDSDIKSYLDSWYANNLEVNYGGSIADAIFCNDKSKNTDGTYKAATRITNNNPSLICENTEDRYTVDTKIGNGYLSKSVGVLTADELVLAGKTITPPNLYDYIGQRYSDLTMTPNSSNGIYVLGSPGHIDNTTVSNFPVYVSPVINLKADILFTGDGSIDTPYQLAS